MKTLVSLFACFVMGGLLAHLGVGLTRWEFWLAMGCIAVVRAFGLPVGKSRE